LARAINELRSLSRSLTKEWLEQFNLIDNLQAEVARNNSANDSADLSLQSSNTAGLPGQTNYICSALSRRHCKMLLSMPVQKTSAICITEDNTAITTIIKDDGSGFDSKLRI
jgi:signal transduction histidine kinase